MSKRPKDDAPKGGWLAPGPDDDQSWDDHEAELATTCPIEGRKPWSKVFVRRINALKKEAGA